MGTKEANVLNTEEIKSIKRVLTEQENNLGILRLKERRIQLDIDELPYKKTLFEQQLKQCRFEINTLLQAISDGNKTLRGEFSIKK